jgi:histidinol-phosphate aminotransferase
MAFDLQSIVRPNILKLKPYSSARSEFAGEAEVFLDANENAFGSPAGDSYNRYPDPLQKELKGRIAELNSVTPEQIFVGNGSDEAIDLLFRIFCEPRRDEAIICPPTYGMYRVSADINDVAIREVPLTAHFELDVDAILAAQTAKTKLLFICSPNNPTGNLMDRASVERLLEEFRGVVVIDEAYIHFASDASMIPSLASYPNLVVMQTFSKAWGMAGLRVGTAYASPEIISLMNAVKPPYNVSSIAQRAVAEAMAERGSVEDWVKRTLEQRSRLIDKLAEFPFVRKIYPTDANFVLVSTDDAKAIYRFLTEAKIVVRDRSSVILCEGCLRIFRRHRRNRKRRN